MSTARGPIWVYNCIKTGDFMHSIRSYYLPVSASLLCLICPFRDIREWSGHLRMNLDGGFQLSSNGQYVALPSRLAELRLEELGRGTPRAVRTATFVAPAVYLETCSKSMLSIHLNPASRTL